MKKRASAYVAAVPLSALPELRELLGNFCGIRGKRCNVVMVRLADDSARCLDQLVEAGLFGSRSEAAAFLIGAGIDAQRELLVKVARHSDEIRKVRQSLRQAAMDALRASGRTPNITRAAKKPKSE